jgi:hypothetical protein
MIKTGEDMIGRACSMANFRNGYRITVEKPKERDYFENLRVCGRIILKRTLKHKMCKDVDSRPIYLPQDSDE